MFFKTRRAACCVLALTVLGQPALADLTPDQVWTEWKSYMASMGYETDATETKRGNDIVLNDVTFVQEITDAQIKTTVSISELIFVDRGDGTVSVEMPDSIPVETSGRDGASEYSTRFVVDQVGDQTIISGTPEAMNYTQTVDRVVVKLVDFEATDADAANVPGEIAFEVIAEDLEADGQIARADTRTYVQNVSARVLTYDAEIGDLSNNSVVDLTGAVQNLTFATTMEQSTDIATNDPAVWFNGDATLESEFTFDASEGNIFISSPDGEFRAETASQGGNGLVNLGGDGLTYDVRQASAQTTVQLANLPVAFDASMAEGRFVLKMPMAASETGQDFQLAMTLKDLMPGDLIWNMFDPAAVLPREPATLDIDLNGKMALTMDLFDPALAETTPPEEFPGELETLNVSNLLVSALGAQLTGDGAFTKTDAPVMPGVPPLAGVLNLTLVGGNGLLDKLIKLGWVEEQDAMGARMMMGLFGVPGDAPDTLNSTLELGQDGSISANGQRLR